MICGSRSLWLFEQRHVFRIPRRWQTLAVVVKFGVFFIFGYKICLAGKGWGWSPLLKSFPCLSQFRLSSFETHCRCPDQAAAATPSSCPHAQAIQSTEFEKVSNKIISIVGLLSSSNGSYWVAFEVKSLCVRFAWKRFVQTKGNKPSWEHVLKALRVNNCTSLK